MMVMVIILRKYLFLDWNTDNLSPKWNKEPDKEIIDQPQIDISKIQNQKL